MAIDWVIQNNLFAELRLHGNTNWTAKSLVALAVLTAWFEAPRLTDAFGKATKLSQALFASVAIRTGFVGYELWKTILDAGQSFLTRVGGNVKLLKNLGHARRGDDIVYLWPNAAARRREARILLRLIEVQGIRGTIWLFTNALSRRRLGKRSRRM